jgi:hypothetical protein
MAGTTDATEFVLRVLSGSESSLGGGDGGGQGGGGGGASKDQNAIQRELTKLNKSTSKGVGATLGIKLGTASLLKQSQVFTGFVGTIFQLMGAMVDVILAPFLPILIPAIRKMAELIPYMAKYAQNIYDFLDRTLFTWLRGGISNLLPEAFKNILIPALAAILVGAFFLKMTGLWNPVISIIKNFIAKPLWAVFKTFVARPLWGIIKTFLAKPLWGTLVKRFAMFKRWDAFFGEGFKKGIKAVLGDVWDNTGGKVFSFLKKSFTTWLDDMGRIGKAVLTAIFKPIDTFLRAGLTKFDKLLKGFPSRLYNFIASPFKAFFKVQKGSLIDRFVAFFKNIYRNTVKGLVGVIKRQIGDFITWFAARIVEVKKAFGSVAADLMTKFKGTGLWKLAVKFFGKGTLVGKAAGLVGRAGAAVGGKLKSGMTPNIGKGFKVLGMSLKGVPIIGAVAELGFGGWATYQDFQKYGAKAAMTRGALTLANTAAALVDPTGLVSAGVSVGSNIAASHLMSKKFDVKESWALQNPELTVKIVTPGQEVRYVMKNNVDADRGVETAIGMELDRADMNSE